jgi:hypothetical protein
LCIRSAIEGDQVDGTDPESTPASAALPVRWHEVSVRNRLPASEIAFWMPHPGEAVKLTAPQLSFLKGALFWADQEELGGVLAKGCDMRVATRLEKLGLVEFVDNCSDIDADEYDDREWPGYRITTAGRALLAPGVDTSRKDTGK